MRLIDADKLKKEMKTYCPAVAQDVVNTVIEDIPEAIVRCKDCTYAVKRNTHANGRRNYKCYKYSMFNNVCGKTITYEVLVDDNHYCAYGERKEE